MITADDAGGLWCPMVRSEQDGNSIGRSRDGQDSRWNDCIGHRCMMWRWGELKPMHRFHVCEASLTATDEQPRDPEVPGSWQWVPASPEAGEPAGWIEPKAEVEARRRGYCGLAGKPDFY